MSRWLILLLLFASSGILAGCQKGPEGSHAPATSSGPVDSASPSSPALTEPETALLEAAGKGDTDGAKSLLAQGVNVNLKGSDGRTPITEAAYGGHLETVKLLLEHGADPSVKKADGETAVSLSAGQKEVSDLFKKVLALVDAASKGDNKSVKELIDKGVPVNALDQYGHAPLTEAAWNGRTETVKLLLEKGADPNIKKSDGSTPVQLAMGQKHQDIVDLLNQSISQPRKAAPEQTATPQPKK